MKKNRQSSGRGLSVFFVGRIAGWVGAGGGWDGREEFYAVAYNLSDEKESALKIKSETI